MLEKPIAQLSGLDVGLLAIAAALIGAGWVFLERHWAEALLLCFAILCLRMAALVWRLL